MENFIEQQLGAAVPKLLISNLTKGFFACPAIPIRETDFGLVTFDFHRLIAHTSATFGTPCSILNNELDFEVLAGMPLQFKDVVLSEIREPKNRPTPASAENLPVNIVRELFGSTDRPLSLHDTARVLERVEELAEGPVQEGRHRIIHYDPADDIDNLSINRFFRRSGVIVESTFAFDEFRVAMIEQVETILKKSITVHNESRRAEVVVAADVVRACENKVFGFGGITGQAALWSQSIQFVHENLDETLAAVVIDPKAMSVMNDMASFITTEVIKRADEFRRHSDEDSHIDSGRGVEAHEKCTISSRNLQYALKAFLPERMARAAVKKGTDEVMKMSTSSDAPNEVGSVLEDAIRSLRLPVAKPAVNYYAGALASVLEDVICSSIMASNGSGILHCHDVLLAFVDNPEVGELFSKSTVRLGGGTKGFFHGALFASIERTTLTPFDKILKEKSLTMQANIGVNVFVDGRCGSFYSFNERTNKFQHHPMLDAVTQETRHERQKGAVALLSEIELTVMKSECCLLFEQEDFSAIEANGYMQEPLAAVQRRRINEIDAEQCSHSYIFPHLAFYRIVKHVACDFNGGLYFTAEALECIQAVTEAYLMRIVENASLAAIHAGRCEIQPRDIRFVKWV